MLYKIGLFLIPFENFFFAPSAGWAAIAPIVFFIYFFQNIKWIGPILKKEKKPKQLSLRENGISIMNLWIS